jgi:serine protease Do
MTACLLLAGSLWLAPGQVLAQEEQGTPVVTLNRVHMAVVHIVSIGSAVPFAEPEPTLEVGAGSGFIIDPAGIVVTNAHVVNGGNLFQVYLSGEEEPRNAVLLGVSECDDLAVLDIRGSGFPYLTWQETPVLDNQLVYAAGFPDGKYSETNGRVQDASGGADSDWASVDQVIRHTAELRPGNSGGPLYNRSGRVVGVNYGSNDRRHIYTAVHKELGQSIVTKLAEGRDIDSIGINGIAFEESDDWYGIWVVAIRSGSPADRAGVQPGDILFQMEGIQLGYAGTMGTYCDILRSHRPSDTIAFDALRGGEYFTGQINGRPLVKYDAGVETADTAAGTQDLTKPLSQESEAAPASTGAPDTLAPPPGYRTVEHQSGAIRLFVPDAWQDEAGGQISRGSAIFGINHIVTEDFGEENMYAAPGAIIDVTRFGGNSLDDTLDLLRIDDVCRFTRRQEVRTEEFVGRVDLWRACDGYEDRTAATAVLQPIGDDGTIIKILVTRFETVSSLETMVAPLGEALLRHPVYWDIPTAVILADSLNVRSGPGTDFEPRGQLTIDATIMVLGKDAESCEWIFVETSTLAGWISADTEYSQLDRDCAALKVVTEESVQQFEFE